MKTLVRLGIESLLGLLVAAVAAGCVSDPYDETVIASLGAPVSLAGYTTSDLGAHDDAATAARTFYVFAMNPWTRKRVALGAAARPNSSSVESGNYDWHLVSFGERVIPSWAWTSEPTRWHAQLRIADSGGLFPGWVLYAFTADEMSCYQREIANGGNVVGSAVDCGGDWDIDLYVNK